METGKEVLVERRQAVATVWLNRPTAHNALSEAVLAQLAEAFDGLGREPAVRVIVLAAHGSAFSAGHDLREMRAQPSDEYYRALFERCTRVMTAIRSAPQPVIARVQGIATAAGCQLVATCDWRSRPNMRDSPFPASTSACSVRRLRWPCRAISRASRPSKCW